MPKTTSVRTAAVVTIFVLAAVLAFFFPVRIPDGLHSLVELSALAALAYALVQHHDAHRHTQVLERIAGSLSTRYIGDFDTYLACLIDELWDAKTCLVCCDIVAYGAFSNHRLGREYRNALVARMNSAQCLRVVCLNAEGRRAFNERQFTDELAAWSVNEPQLNQTDAFYASLRRLLERAKKDDGPDTLSPETFLALLEVEDAGLVTTLTSAHCTETSEQIPLNFWVIDRNRAIFAVPSSLHATNEYGFETSDTTLIRELERLHEGYEKRATVALRKVKTS